MTSAPKTRLAPGETSIDRIAIKKNKDGVYRHTWSVRLWSGKLYRTTTEAKTAGDFRAKARAKAAEVLASDGGGPWRPSSPAEKYIDEVAAPRISDSAAIKDLSKKRYLAALALIRRELKGRTLHDVAKFDTLETALRAIAATAPGSVGTARTVLTTWVLDPMVRSGLAAGNPLRGARLDLAKPAARPEVRRTLTRAEWDAVVEHLLVRDTSPLLMPTKHKNIRKSTRAVHARAVRLMLLQAVTGLRIAEANLVRWRHVVETEGHILIDATSDIVKGRKGREKGRFIPVLRDDVANYLREHRGEPDEYVVGAPSSTAIAWNPTNADDSVPELYRQVAEATGVAILAGLRSHSWRATLHGVFADRIDPATRANIFGHTEAIADQYYNDRRNIETLLHSVTL